MNRLSEREIIRQLAEQTAKRITRSVVVHLQRLKECTLSGDDSVLENIWDEICVQVQGDESVAWDVYVTTIEGILEGEVQELPDYEQAALWLQTEEGENWDSDEEEERDPNPVLRDDIVEYLLRDYVLDEARQWRNPRIRAYIESGYSSD
jgi:hypothetical protein